MNPKITSTSELWDYPEPFVISVTVLESDIDSYQHVNNSVYPRWADECARQHSKAAGVDTEDAEALGYGMAVRESRITYNSPAFLGEDILVANWLTLCDGRLRASRYFQVLRESDGVTLARASMDYICIRIETGKPCRMPKLFRESYAVKESVQRLLLAEQAK
jgi:acyl-CoA thioester hydrolase